MTTRRGFLFNSILALAAGRTALAQSQATPQTTTQTTHPNLADVDRARILAAAAHSVAIPVAGVGDPQSPAFLTFTLHLAALAAACIVDPTNAAPLAARASAELRAWFVTPETRLPAAPPGGNFEAIADLAALAEVAVAIPFLPLPAELLQPLKAWFRDFLVYLTTSRTALLARDAKSQVASAWLLQVAAVARLLEDEKILAEARHRFKTVTIRAQIDANGFFPHELVSDFPLRDSLYNLDLLAGVCVLLSTRFESVWTHELQDGPGMRVAIARHAPYIADRRTWPYPADRTGFNLLPGRRPALLFAGRAYSQTDYITLWRSLNPDPTDPELLRAFPVRQPILWFVPARG